MHALQESSAASATRDGSLAARRAMHGNNKLQIGLFGPNCSSGRAVTLVPERWSGNWPDNKRLGADGGRGRHRLSAADRALEGLWRRHRLPGHHAGNHHLGDRASGLHQAHHRVRHRACADLQSGGGGQGNGHRRSHRRGPLRAQHRGRLERGRVRHVRRRAARPRGPLRVRPGMDRRHQDDLVRPRGLRLQGQISRHEGHSRQAEAVRRRAAGDHECRRIGEPARRSR